MKPHAEHLQEIDLETEGGIIDHALNNSGKLKTRQGSGSMKQAEAHNAVLRGVKKAMRGKTPTLTNAHELVKGGFKSGYNSRGSMPGKRLLLKKYPEHRHAALFTQIVMNNSEYRRTSPDNRKRGKTRRDD